MPTFTATIYCGLRPGYSGTAYEPQMARDIIAQYISAHPICVTVTPTEFIYPSGSEPGVIVGLINYPRFPQSPAAIKDHALFLADRLRHGLGQHRVSIVMPNETVMLGGME